MQAKLYYCYSFLFKVLLKLKSTVLTLQSRKWDYEARAPEYTKRKKKKRIFSQKSSFEQEKNKKAWNANYIFVFSVSPLNMGLKANPNKTNKC